MRVDLAGIHIDDLSLDEAVNRVGEFLASPEPHLIVTPNPEIIVASQKDAELKETLNSADLRAPDGISMVVVSRLLGTPLKERVAGIDLMLRIIELCVDTQKRVFLLGSKPGVAEEAAAKLEMKYPGIQIAGAWHGYFLDDDPDIIERIRKAAPDALFAGLGAGRQEKWLHKHLKDLNARVNMAVGGSLDVISGRKKRAPKWVQALYIEWLYRLVTEPKRWKRQLALPKFLYLTLFRKVI
jgi:N-acetylglucosaminyldiphosphoundecaprenol N-acetyl-beta-D-mannosaminyltransferase